MTDHVAAESSTISLVKVIIEGRRGVRDVIRCGRALRDLRRITAATRERCAHCDNRLAAETIRGLILAKLQEAECEPSVKAKLIAKMKDMPAEAVGKLGERLIEAGLANAPLLIGLVTKAVF